MRPIGRVEGCGLAAACLVVPGVAWGQAAGAVPVQAPEVPLDQAVDVDPGATCLEPARLVASVQAWLGRERVGGDVRVHVQGNPQRTTSASFRIERGGKVRERRFDALPAGCEDATAVVGLAVAMAIDADVMKAFVEPPAPAAPKQRSSLEVQAAVGFDVLPSASVGGAVAYEFGIASWLSGRVEVFEQSSWGNTVDGATGFFDVYLAAVSPQLCAGGDVDARVRFELCSGLPTGLVLARGRDFAVSHDSSGFWLDASVGARLTFVAGIPWALDVDGIFPIRVPSFQAENATGASVYRSPNAAGALLSLGPSFNL